MQALNERAAIEFVPAVTIEDVFAATFDGKRRARPRAAQAIERQAAMPAGSS